MVGIRSMVREVGVVVVVVCSGEGGCGGGV